MDGRLPETPHTISSGLGNWRMALWFLWYASKCLKCVLWGENAQIRGICAKRSIQTGSNPSVFRSKDEAFVSFDVKTLFAYYFDKQILVIK